MDIHIKDTGICMYEISDLMLYNIPNLEPGLILHLIN